MFYQDAFIGGAIARLARIGDNALVDVYDLDTIYLDTDGFRVAPSLVIWHNRYKMPCRTLCLGEYYRKRFCPVNFSWTPAKKHHVNASRYRIWATGYRRPRASAETTLVGEAAVANFSCASTVDLRNGNTIVALNMSECLQCSADVRNASARAKAKRAGG